MRVVGRPGGAGPPGRDSDILRACKCVKGIYMHLKVRSPAPSVCSSGEGRGSEALGPRVAGNAKANLDAAPANAWRYRHAGTRVRTPPPSPPLSPDPQSHGLFIPPSHARTHPGDSVARIGRRPGVSPGRRGAWRATRPERTATRRSAGSRWSASRARAGWHEKRSRGRSCGPGRR